MNFISIGFIIFVLVVFIIYWFLNFKKSGIQNLILLLSSYIFYGLLDIKFLLILICISGLGYSCGILCSEIQNIKAKRIIFPAVVILISSALLYFKYYNFFILEFVNFVSMFGYNLSNSPLNIILPVGISFYTFQSIGYVIDVYNGRIKPEKNIINYLLFVSYFPQIFAGPIGRGKDLLPQYNKLRNFDYDFAKDGLRLILWGLFKKIVIADQIGIIADNIFNDYGNYTGSTLALGAIFYSFQIYADFSGYTDIARGTAKLFGINLMLNFNYPYFAKDIIDFWRRWHISLSTWLRDYLFLPLSYIFYRKFNNIKISGRRKEYLVYTVAILITWFLGGLWHGAGTTFIVWGLLHGVSLVLWNNSKKIRTKFFKSIKINTNSAVFIFLQSAFTFFLVTFFWIFFRAGEMNTAIGYIENLFKPDIFTLPVYIKYTPYILILFTIEFLQRNKEHPLVIDSIKWKPVRWGIYYAMLLIILNFTGDRSSFIYFQF